MKPNLYASIIYNMAIVSYLKNNKIARQIKQKYERILSGDKKHTTVVTFLNHHSFFCPFSNKLLFYQKAFPLYDKQLTKICHYIKKKHSEEINIIDVGSNVGDTVLSIGIKKAFYLCIEGNELYSKHIKTNLRLFNYSLEKVYLSDSTENKYIYEQENSTGHLVETSETVDKISTTYLDKLIETKYTDRKFDFLKIDTDGFDFKVIRGAKKLLKRDRPLLYFEWDKAYCKEQGENPLSIFETLDDLGYNECILFDNYGNLIRKIDTSNIGLLKSYIENTLGDGLPYYYDVLSIPNDGDFSTKEILSIF